MKVVYEDNHVIIVAKESGEIVQGDKTGISGTVLTDHFSRQMKMKQKSHYCPRKSVNILESDIL